MPHINNPSEQISPNLDSWKAEASNDVFTLLEHPSIKGMKGETPGDKVTKEETMYEAHVRAGLVTTITVTISGSGTTSVFF